MSKELKGAFASAKPLEEALEPEEIEEFTQEDLEQVSFGMNLKYNENFNGKRFYKGEITKPFLTHYLFECNPEEVRLIEIDKFSEPKQKLIRKKLSEEPEEEEIEEEDMESLPEKTIEHPLSEEFKQDKENGKKKLTKNSRKKLIDTIKTRVAERDSYRRALKELINVFMNQEIQAKLSKDTIEVIQNLMEET